jgi:hypothetical protein
MTLQLDGTENTLCTFYASRSFDMAMMVWLLQWMVAPESMPKMTWHGDWDGYVFDNIPEFDEKE